jgi:hypothetical protein
MIDELERLLRALVESPDDELVKVLVLASKIGADLERQACIDVIATSGDLFASVVDQAEAQKRIRERGSK